eukprot:5884285-Amphidinium_carterae.2
MARYLGKLLQLSSSKRPWEAAGQSCCQGRKGGQLKGRKGSKICFVTEEGHEMTILAGMMRRGSKESSPRCQHPCNLKVASRLRGCLRLSSRKTHGS